MTIMLSGKDYLKEIQGNCHALTKTRKISPNERVDEIIVYPLNLESVLESHYAGCFINNEKDAKSCIERINSGNNESASELMTQRNNYSESLHL